MKKTALLITVMVVFLSIASLIHARAWDPAWSPDGSQIVYTCDYGGDTNIWIANADGSNAVQLTTQPNVDWDPAWSPDGSKILFSHDRDGDGVVYNVWTIDVDGTHLTQLTFGNSWETAAVWTPDGDHIAFDGIYMINADGSNQQPTALGAHPSFRGDGTRMVYTNGNEIYTADPDGSNPVRLTNDAFLDWHPDFSPDGSKIAFTSDRDGTNAIWTMDADGSNLFRVADCSATGEPQWSPDGSTIIFEGVDHNTIWKVNSDGSGLTLIPTPTEFSIFCSVMNVHNIGDTVHTTIAVEINHFWGSLPSGIDEITVSLHRPDGSQSVIATYPDDPDWVYTGQWNEFSIAIPGSPAIGYYEARVRSGSIWVSGADIQTRLFTIPVPDSQTFSPVSGETVSSKTPIFSWDPVVVDDPDAPPLFYRLEVSDMSGDRVWASGRSEGMTSCAVPEGRLLPGDTYQWRVRVTDSNNYVEVQNRANSEYIAFSMANPLSHSASPAITIDDWGAATWSGYGWTNLDLWVQVFDQDGVAYDGSSHHVTVTTPNNDTWNLDLNYARGAVGYYGGWSGVFPQSGTYTFTVTDPEDNVAVVQDVLVVNPIEPTAEDYISPSNMDEYIAATFDNVYVNGSLYEDFSAYSDISSIDTNKWNPPGDCAEIVNEAVQLNISGSVGRGNCALSVADPASADIIQADITVNSISSNDAPRARIRGLYYFNGYGDVSGIISVKGDRVYYSVSEEYLANGVYSWKTLVEEDLMTVTTGQTVTVSIDWDGSTLTFSAFDTNSPGTVYSGYHSAPGLVAPPNIGREMLLQIRTNLTTPDTTPTFSWDPVTGAESYRIRIYDGSEQRTLWRGYTNETQYMIPPGVLEPDSYYRFRIDAYGDHFPLNQNNAAGSDRYRFYTDTYESPLPYIEFDSAGVQTWNGYGTDPFISFWVKIHDAQGVPGNIRSVKVQFPGSGPIIDLLHDASRDPSPTSGFYKNDVFMDPTGMAGTYTFVVEDWDGNVYQTTEDLDANAIGSPDPADFATTVTGTAVDVDWDDVTGAAFYRLEIYDENFKRIHALATTDSQYSVPEGLLKANTFYRYRVTTRREFFDQNVDNGSTSPWSRYAYPTFVTTPNAGSSAPLVDLNDHGVAVWHTQKEGGSGSTWLLGFNVKVSDADGVPENIKQVTVTFPGGHTTRDLVFESTVSSTEGTYWYHEWYDDQGDIPDGIYTFTVTDYNDLSVQIDDALVKNTLLIPENCQPVSGSTIDETTPEISWDSVAGAAVYKVRIYEGFDSLIHESDPHSETTFDVPSDLLEEGKTYAYRVYAYRENYPTEETDNISVNAIYPSERPYFTVEKDMEPLEPPEIDAMVFDGCISERCKSTVAVTATDPAGGNLSYVWTAPDGGSIEGSGDVIEFDPPAPSLEPACLPYRVTVAVTSDVSGLTTEQTADIMVKLAGDANGDSVVNIIDKVIVRNSFGSSGPNPADVDCSGVVNIIDKVIVRNQFGQRGCRCP